MAKVKGEKAEKFFKSRKRPGKVVKGCKNSPS